MDFSLILVPFWRVLGRVWEAWGSSWAFQKGSQKGKINFFNKIGILKGFGEGLGRVLGGFWEGFGRVWGGFWEDLGRVLGGFWEEIWFALACFGLL